MQLKEKRKQPSRPSGTSTAPNSSGEGKAVVILSVQREMNCAFNGDEARVRNSDVLSVFKCGRSFQLNLPKENLIVLFVYLLLRYFHINGANIRPFLGDMIPGPLASHWLTGTLL